MMPEEATDHFPTSDKPRSVQRTCKGQSAHSGSVNTVSEVLSAVLEAQPTRCPSVGRGQTGDRCGAP